MTVSQVGFHLVLPNKFEALAPLVEKAKNDLRLRFNMLKIQGSTISLKKQSKVLQRRKALDQKKAAIEGRKSIFELESELPSHTSTGSTKVKENHATIKSYQQQSSSLYSYSNASQHATTSIKILSSVILMSFDQQSCVPCVANLLTIQRKSSKERHRQTMVLLHVIILIVLDENMDL
ncbi:uncharacterized protein BX664DRAFT_350606 [Halteromyces radiatus]|uniref:uncharacterized protein n=1 Tax=Halteromyces radiatus TaxID=101107 RepID=UPI0022210393|nr:uncharacterized protein BX664DRAFT_350606 [Halteromyces radiatus]KAI8086188.1 hypothetical protein BX664DRAFT_350606 [Halteromyces radiatus]